MADGKKLAASGYHAIAEITFRLPETEKSEDCE
jgi:hypothetical protein